MGEEKKLDPTQSKIEKLIQYAREEYDVPKVVIDEAEEEYKALLETLDDY